MYDKVIPFGILTNYRSFVLFDRNEGSKKYHLIDFTELTKEDKLKEFIALFSREQVEKGFITEVIKQSIVEEREFISEGALDNFSLINLLIFESVLKLMSCFESSRALSSHFFLEKLKNKQGKLLSNSLTKSIWFGNLILGLLCLFLPAI